VKACVQQLRKHLRQQLKSVGAQISHHTLAHNRLKRDERLLRITPDPRSITNPIRIRECAPFPRRDRCASTPGLHDRTPSGS
jgi:hypothetical protein